jgi:predicted phosphoribosyltransferase
MIFHDRKDAGRKLAAALIGFKGKACVVLALPRGGVPVAAEVAEVLKAPLDLLLVRKIGAPLQPELAVGSVIDGGEPIIVRDPRIMQMTGTSETAFRAVCERELDEIERRRKFYLGSRRPVNLKGHIAIIVDDGLATGNTMRAALEGARLRKPAMLVMAVPVAPRSTVEDLRDKADEIFCLSTPEPFDSVGSFYEDFRQTSDDEVIALLNRYGEKQPHGANRVRM